MRGTIGGLKFPFIHAWTYGPKCADANPFLKLQPATLFEHGTSKKRAVATVIRDTKEHGWLAIDPVAGCRDIQPQTVVYDRPTTREIAFPNLFSDYEAYLVGSILRSGVPVQLRGLDGWMGHGYCSVNLMWASAAPALLD